MTIAAINNSSDNPAVWGGYVVATCLLARDDADRLDLSVFVFIMGYRLFSPFEAYMKGLTEAFSRMLRRMIIFGVVTLLQEVSYLGYGTLANFLSGRTHLPAT